MPNGADNRVPIASSSAVIGAEDTQYCLLASKAGVIGLTLAIVVDHAADAIRAVRSARER